MLRIYLTLTHNCTIIVLKIRIHKVCTQKGEKNVETIGIIKEMDNLGRLVIPKPLRERYGISGKIEIISTKDGVLIRPFENDVKK